MTAGGPERAALPPERPRLPFRQCNWAILRKSALRLR